MNQNIFVKLQVVCLSMVMAGCASLGSNFSELKPKSKNNAILYVYRPKAFSGWIRSPDVFVNAKKIGSVPNGGYIVAEVPPGSMEISQGSFKGEEPGHIKGTLKKNEIYFVRFDLSIPTLKQQVLSSGKISDEKCPYRSINFISSPGFFPK